MYPKPPSKGAFQKTRLNAAYVKSDGRPVFMRNEVFNTYHVGNPIPGETHRSKGGVIAVLPEVNSKNGYSIIKCLTKTLRKNKLLMV